MEETQLAETRKRLASTLSDEKACKRSRGESQNIVPRHTDDRAHHTQCSVEAMLSVPLEVIFRDAPPTSLLSVTQQQNRQKPLLTRAEAQTLIRTSQLAYEIDLLIQLTSEALSDKLWCRSMSQKLEQNNNPFLRALIPLLAIHGELVPNAALRTFQKQLDQLLVQLEKCVVSLRQHSEQNWAVAESLMDALGFQLELVGGDRAVSPLALEKRIVGDIEEEVCRRIESLLGLVATAPDTDRGEDSEGGNVDIEFNMSMDEFCSCLFGVEKDSPDSSHRDRYDAESPGIGRNMDLSKEFHAADKMSQSGDRLASSPDEDEPTEQQSFEPSQERNMLINACNTDKMAGQIQGNELESSSQSAAVALAALFSGRSLHYR